jgi:hypothetical protein
LNPLPPDPAPITPGNLALREELKEFHGKLKELDAATKKRQPPKSLRSDFSTYRDCLQKRVDILRLEASFDPNSTVVKSELKAWTHAFPKWLANFQRTRSVVESWLEKQHKKAGTSDRSLAVEQDTKAVPKATIRRSNAGAKKARKGGRTESPIKVLRWKAIRLVYARQPNLEGKDFWKLVHQNGGLPELTWGKQGCPRRLDDAFDIPRWKQFLNGEKSRALHDVKRSK